QQVVVPPGTVFDERVFDTAYVAQSGMASSQTASTDLVGISRALVAQQQAAGLFTSVLGTPEKVLGNDRYLLINRPDTVSSAISAAAASTQRPDPLGVPQWKPAEQGYRWRTSILKANRSPRQDGDVVLSALRQRPQGMTEPMLRDLVVFTGGAENDPAISETIWLLEQLEQLKGQLSMQGINLAVQGPGALRGFYNDAGVGASIPEHAHTQATPHPMKAEGEALDPIARVGDVTFSFIQGWAGPIFAVRSDRTTIYVAPRLILAPPPVAQDLDGYLAKDRAERDQSGEYLLGAAAREMLGTMIAMDDSTFDRLTVEAADQIVAGSLVSREALEPVVQVIRSRAQVTSGVEEETRTLQGSDVSGPIFMDLKGVPQTVFRHRISTSTVIPAVASGTRLLLTQEGVLPSAVIEQFARRGWAVETLSAEATPERLAGEVRAGLREWSGSVLVVAATELKEAVGFLPIEARLTTVFVDREMVSGMAPNVLLAFLVQSLEAFPGGIRQLESVTQTGADEFQATASQV
ncbi:MAG: hypothetical protein Q7J69_00485, partial [Candidatus Omnitrophota bacterium]|nr:hypothetical protein [Candidatus Omnitrophota bacterium]